MKILVTDPITDSGIEIIKKSGMKIEYIPNAAEDEKFESVKDAHGLIIRSGTIVDSKMINNARKLQVIGRAGVGVDNIDIISATRKGVVVMNTPDVNTISAAEHTIALLLALSRNVHLGHMSIKLGRWDRHKLVGTELHKKSIGIVGLGKIGREVIKRCKSFGMKVYGYDPFVNAELFLDQGINLVDLDLLTSKSDFISLHLPLNNETRGLFDFDRFSKMKPSAMIINVARGGIINELHLARALKEKVISGAAIDVFKNEPIDFNNPLVNMTNVLLSPHLGASTKEAKEGVSRAICNQVINYLANEKLSNALNIPISDISLLKEIQPFLDLSELLGKILSQIVDNAIKHIKIDCQGTAEEVRPIGLAAIKGLLSSTVPDRINYINAESISKELGLAVETKYSNVESNYKNSISITVNSLNEEFKISGSVFDDNKPRLINLLGNNMEVTPNGPMLFLSNNDIPGVIGKIGTLLGNQKVNIAAYLLNRDKINNKAFAVIRLDDALCQNQLKLLKQLEEIEFIKQIIV